MSILIKGMEMPKSCYECRFAFDGMCFANRGRKDVGITNSCPLIEVPDQKHGKWLITDRYHDFCDGTELSIWKCSECGDEFSLEGERPTKKYCSNCGAYMRGES